MKSPKEVEDIRGYHGVAACFTIEDEKIIVLASSVNTLENIYNKLLKGKKKAQFRADYCKSAILVSKHHIMGGREGIKE